MGVVKIRGKQSRLGVFILLAVLLISLVIPVVEADEEEKTTVVINSKDWRALYLASAYAHFTGADFVFFSKLSDSQLKTRMILKDTQVQVFESKQDPVVKNYASFLRVNGYEDFSSYEYDSLEDFQEYIDKQVDTNGYYVITSDFGLDALTGAPLVAEKRLLPLFLTHDSKKFVELKTKQKESYIVGRAPVRMLEGLEGEFIQGFPQITMDQVSKTVLKNLKDSNWGLIMRIDTVDLPVIWKGYPIFVFYADEYLDELTQTVKDSNIVNFEVIGAGTADIAQSIELKSQRNLNFILKYGRKVTNYPGLEDSILGLDSVAFNYPQEILSIASTTYYESLSTLAVTYKNEGNVNLLFFSNVEFDGQPLSDLNTHAIAPGETITIPYVLDVPPTGLDVLITTRYGASLPLRFAILGEAGTLFYSETAQEGPYAEQQAVEIVRSGFDTQLGVLEVVMKNPYDVPVQVFLELVINDSDVIASKVITINPRGKETINIEAPYIPNDKILGKEFNLNAYVGTDDTIVLSTTPLLIRKKSTNRILGLVIGEGASTALQVVAVVILIFIVLFLYFLFFVARKKRKDNKRPPKMAVVTRKQASKTKKNSRQSSATRKRKSHAKK